MDLLSEMFRKAVVIYEIFDNRQKYAVPYLKTLLLAHLEVIVDSIPSMDLCHTRNPVQK